MNSITSLYIAHVEPKFTAEYVADCLDKSGIAKVSKIALEKVGRFKRAWVDIKTWHDTEAAFNFIQRLRNSSVEAKFVHSDDDWWAVEVNKFPHKTDSSKAKNQLTVFNEVRDHCFDDCESNDCVIDILDVAHDDAADFDEYVKEIDFWRNNPDCHPLVRQNSIDNEFIEEIKKPTYSNWNDYSDAMWDHYFW